MATKKKLFITNERMLLLMEWALQHGIADTESGYLEMIDFPRTNIRNVRTGHQSFTKEHILLACKVTGASADYIFGFTNAIARRKPDRGIEALKLAVHAIELEMKNGHR